MHNSLFQYLLIFFLCKKSFTEVQQVNPVINGKLYICSNLLPFSTSISVNSYFSFKMFKCHLKKGRKVVFIVLKINGNQQAYITFHI